MDKLVKSGIQIPWILKQVVSIPDTITMRSCRRRGYPNPADVGFVMVPTLAPVVTQDSGRFRTLTELLFRGLHAVS